MSKFLDVCSAHYVTNKYLNSTAKPVEPIQAEEFGDSPALHWMTYLILSFYIPDFICS